MQDWFRQVGLMDLTDITILVRLLLASLCGGALGFERMRKLRAAGLRTYMMVCVGACAAMVIGIFLTVNTSQTDSTRIAAQVVSGIGFIGAGTIIFTGYSRVKGLTTAAGLWATAMLGLAIGAGMYVGAIMILLVLLMGIVLGSVVQGRFLAKSDRLRCYVLLDDEQSFKVLLYELKRNAYRIIDFDSKIVIGNCLGLSLTLTLPHGVDHNHALEFLQACGGTAFAEEI